MINQYYTIKLKIELLEEIIKMDFPDFVVSKKIKTLVSSSVILKDINMAYLPKFDENNVLYIGFFNTGAYQETIGGYGGLKHCLIPEPKHILIRRDEDGKIFTELFSEEQTADDYLRILGYYR
jgi:arginine decarboxylase-like protein